MNRLLFHLEFNNLLPPNQFGFRPGRSTLHSIHLARESMIESRAQGKTVLIATRDIKKAFDTVWLEGLLFKINVKLQIDMHFTAFIYNYTFDRVVSPTFANHFGPSFSPKSGVPQGSCLGPILFLIFVHDIPNPYYNDTLVFQFADDNVQIVRSDSTGPNRAISAQSKLKRELTRTLEWEEKWKIKTSWDKSYVSFAGTSLDTLEAIGGIVIRGNPIEIKNNVKMLGYTFTNFLSSTAHVNVIVNKAKYHLAKLYRFRSAPVKIKRYLYITLIRSLLDYPCTELNSSGIGNKLSLQRIQNKALRLILNIKLSDRIRSEEMHQRAKLEPINIRLAKLSCKLLYRMKELYLNPDQDLELAPFFKLLVDYEVEGDPIRPPPRPYGAHIHETIFTPGYGRLPLMLTLPEERENFPIPLPVYV